MHTLVSDLICTWVAALALCFGAMLFGSASTYDTETMIEMYGLIVIALLGAAVATVGQLLGWIGIW